MTSRVVVALRVVIALALGGSVVVQAGIVATWWFETAGRTRSTEVSLVVIGVLGVATLQVTAVCIWRLLTMVEHGTVFSRAAFRYVDVVIGSIGLAAVLVFSVAVVGRFANHATPGDEVAPGLLVLVSGLAVVTAGVALLVYVMRTLLAQAVTLDSEARHLQAELDGVI